MRLKLSFVILISVVLLIKEVQADEIIEGRPKIGLALSGGGAKGLIYIPLLKAIDSLGIKIDYLTGTSMGGVIGGLYAIGYTGVELDSIARSLDWDHILRDRLSLSKVNMEEKDEHGKYLVEFKGNTWKPTLPKGVIEGQNILTFLNSLTSDFLYIDDFSDFKIPFKCFTADLVSGVPLEMNSGNLALALRTTMSIPTIFSPIDTSGMILVDGGLLKNFPVEDVQKMGADFIIGANCSGSQMLKEEMSTLFKIFERMMNINTTENYPKQKELCDILIDFSEALKYLNITVSDFGRVEEILELGETIVANFVPLLSQVAEQQRVFMPQLPDSYVHWRANHAIKLDNIKTSVYDNEFRAIIKNKIEFEDPDHATNYEINRAVDRIYGTRFFDRVYYYYDYGQDSIPKLVYKTEGANKFSYKLGLHYDPELSAGIIMNFTYRTLGKMTSRVLLSVDISDNPKIRSGYQVYFGNSSWWLSTEQFFSSIKQTNYAKDGALGSYKHIYASGNVSVNLTVGQNNLVSIGSQIEYLNRKALLKAGDRAMYQTLSQMITKSPYYNLNLFLNLKRNTLNQKAYPTKGIFVQGLLKFVPFGNGHLEFYERTDVNDELEDIYTTKRPELSSYAKLRLVYEQYVPLHRIVTLHYRWDAGLMFITHGLKGRSFDYARQDAYFMGGVEDREKERLNNYIAFWGNREGYTHAFNFSSLSIGGQVEAIKNLFIVPKFTVLSHDGINSDVYGSESIYINQWEGNVNWAWSGGLELAYKTPLGPIKANISKASNYNEWIFYAAVGFRF